jgi:HAD superfamily hydrolase (TIGR01509 family)
MIILIPLGGIGERFKKEGYNLPKALIKVDNKPILFHLLDNLNLNEVNNINFVYIPYNKEYIEHALEQLLIERYPNIKFVFFVLENNTRGAADTIRIALNNIDESITDGPILCLDSDNFYTIDIIQLWNGENKVFTFQDKRDDPIYSYVTTNNNNTNNNILTDIREKDKISDNACCGAYGFQSWQQLLYYTTFVIDNKLTQKNEYYTSCVIKEMLNQKIEFKNTNIKNKHYYSLGTPKQTKEYEYSFLFDLDGTLVNTDHIYTEVWNLIFKKYHFGFVVDKIFFDNFIKGKNDSLFLNYLLPNIPIEQIKEISDLKDELFIELLKKNEKSILLNGVLDFFEINKNRKIAIVTSCNKKSAEYIIEYTGLNNYISLLITANDCIKHKPDPEPYLKAIGQLKLDKEKTIIFEDSYSGYTSAKNAQVYKIILVYNENSCNDIINANEYKITDYTNVNIEEILNMNNNRNSTQNNVCTILKNKLIKSQPIKDIIRNKDELKTGYICDIQSYKMIFNNNSSENIVLKINNTENELSKTAEKMNLYGNEINFYTNIRDSIRSHIICVPKCYGVVSIDNNGTRKGIILENLFKYEGQFNIDLNKDTQTLLNLVYEISKLHIKFYFIKENEVPLNMRNVTTPNDLVFFKQLIFERFETFIQKNKLVLKEKEIEVMYNCFQNYEKNVIQTSTFPLSFCHGDLKSANIFYKSQSDSNNNYIPYFLDWQYIQLNKGVSDIVFLLVESIKFDKIKVELVLNYYYCLISEKIKDYSYDEYLKDFKTNLCIFPFVVCVWFNSEDNDKLLDKIFPIRFMKNLMEYYDYFLI